MVLWLRRCLAIRISLIAVAAGFSAGSARAASPPAPPASAPSSGGRGALPDSGPALSVTSMAGSAQYTCVVGDHEGIEDAEARTGADVVCAELAKQRAPAGEYEVRFGALGARQIVTLVQRSTGEERQMPITGMEEILVAAPRIVAALTKSSSLAKTTDVENVAQAEARTPQLKPSAKSFALGIAGTSAVGVSPGISGGVGMRLAFRFAQAAVVMDGRAGGIGSGDDKLGYADLGVGGRYYFSNEDISPFVAGGLELAYFQANRGNGDFNLTGSGMGAYAEAGVEVFRTTRNGLLAMLRADFPTFPLKGTGDSPSVVDTNGGTVSFVVPSDSRYVVPISLEIGIVFN